MSRVNWGIKRAGSLLQYRPARNLIIVAAPRPQSPAHCTKLKDLPVKVQKTLKEEAGSNQVGDMSQSSEAAKRCTMRPSMKEVFPRICFLTRMTRSSADAKKPLCSRRP